jgi:hypothetical protein
MGAGRWDSTTYASYSAGIKDKGTYEVFKERHLHPNLDPLNAKMRESRDSADNPLSNAIIVALDVTGSMGMIATELAKTGLGRLFTAILDDKPVTDPHVMFMAVGDVHCDRAPLQVSQFEADTRIIEQLAQIYVEGGGGGNNTESYNLPWYFAAAHTSIDCWDKRKRKGYLFTVGDEEAPSALSQDQLRRFVDPEAPRGLSNEEALGAARERYHVFHIIVDEGSHARSHPDAVDTTWKKLLGQNVIHLPDYRKLTEVIVAAIAATEGNSASSSTDLAVINAVKHLVAA